MVDNGEIVNTGSCIHRRNAVPINGLQVMDTSVRPAGSAHSIRPRLTGVFA